MILEAIRSLGHTLASQLLSSSRRRRCHVKFVQGHAECLSAGGHIYRFKTTCCAVAQNFLLLHILLHKSVPKPPKTPHYR